MFKKNQIPLALLLSSSIISTAAFAQFSAVGQESMSPNLPNLPKQGPEDMGKLNLELSASQQKLTSGFGNWRDVTLRGTYSLPSNVLQAELSQNQRFGTSGTFIGLGDTYTFNEDWFGSVAVGFGDGAFYLPKYRVDASVSRKLLPQRNLVATVGVGYYNAPTGYSDKSIALSAAYYFDSPFILEGGVRVNYSNPGSGKTSQQFVAGTYGRNKEDLITGRYGWGSEGYLATTASNQLVDFRSDEVSLAWRHWFAPATGWLVSANRYTNPSYKRTGVTVGLFHDF